MNFFLLKLLCKTCCTAERPRSKALLEHCESGDRSSVAILCRLHASLIYNLQYSHEHRLAHTQEFHLVHLLDPWWPLCWYTDVVDRGAPCACPAPSDGRGSLLDLMASLQRLSQALHDQGERPQCHTYVNLQPNLMVPAGEAVPCHGSARRRGSWSASYLHHLHQKHSLGQQPLPAVVEQHNRTLALALHMIHLLPVSCARNLTERSCHPK